MGTQQIPAPSLSAVKHSSAPNPLLAQGCSTLVGVARVGLRFMRMRS